MAWTDTLKSDLEKKDAKDLEPIQKPTLGSNLIDPTKEEALAIVEALRAGKSPHEVKLSVKRGPLSFSIEQIKEAGQVWQAVLAAKTAPKAVEGEIKP